MMATLADLAETERPGHTDGISVVPTLLGRPDRQERRDHLYWEYHMGKQQAVRMGRWKGVRFGGTKEPIELYDLSRDIGETKNMADDQAEIIERMDELMRKARENSEFTAFWPLPEKRLDNVKYDKVIYDQLEKGIDWDKH
jgi:arylsulfatase A-like enzyme